MSVDFDKWRCNQYTVLSFDRRDDTEEQKNWELKSQLRAIPVPGSRRQKLPSNFGGTSAW